MVGADADLIWEYLRMVEDPEIPILNVIEMGIVRDLLWDEVEKKWRVIITPTYSGCPAMKAIEDDIKETLAELQVKNVVVETVLSPPWTTDWMTDDAREKLRSTGIAPPERGSADKGLLMGKINEVPCPRCSSSNTIMVSQFGTTACKALYKCGDCLEPFDHFKCI